MIITIPPIPPIPTGQSGWRKTITALGRGQSGCAIEGAWLQAGDAVDLPGGTLVIAVDNATVGWENHYRTGERYPVQDATVAAHIVTADGLTQLWVRHYKTARSAVGATTAKKLAALLKEHPAPTGDVTVTVIQEAQRPNYRPGPCRWCGTEVPKGYGHLVGHGAAAVVEHWETCPASFRQALNGTPCALCAVTVGAPDAQAAMVMVREGAGRWETRHTDSVRCTETRPESWEEYQARMAQYRADVDAAERQRVAVAKQKAGAAAKRKATREAKAKATHEAEQARVAALAVVTTAEKQLFDKSLGGSRVELVEVTCHLSDGTTTLRWVVRTYTAETGWNGEDYDPDLGQSTEYTRLADARAAYQTYKFTRAATSQSTGRACDECRQGGGRHLRRDSNGVAGVVCGQCNREPDYGLSFA
jgi:hypothetical protein